MTDSPNVELVRSIYADWEDGDYRATEWAHPEIEYIVVGGPSPGRWTGLRGMAEAAREIFSGWERVRTVADDYLELDGERVLVLDHRRGHGKASGFDIGRMSTDAANLFHLSHGRVALLVFYFDRGQALADVGLSPEAQRP